MLRPSTRTRPASISSRPETQLSRVVLPEPDGGLDRLGVLFRVDLAAQSHTPMVDGDVVRSRPTPVRPDQRIGVDLLPDLLVGPCERTDEVVAGDDADETAALHDRQARNAIL